MSAFVALWNRKMKPIERDLPIRLMAAGQTPINDGESLWLDGSVALAHRHLWITTEEVGENQPLVEGMTGTVFSGVVRLDNRTEIIQRIGLTRKEGETYSDAQLVLESYLKWGAECPQYLLGDFAFVIWDPREQRLFAARDPLGAEELYYYSTPDCVIFATDLMMILEHPDVTPRLNETMVGQYLAVDLSDETDTFYEAIHHLPPAHTMVVGQDDSRLARYWDVDNTTTLRYKSSQDYAEHYRELLNEAIRCRLRSVHPIGVSLSGGLDSSALTCLMAEMMAKLSNPQDVLRCYSYVFDSCSSCDERRYIDPVIDWANHSFPTTSIKINGDGYYPTPMDTTWPVGREHPFQDPYTYLVRAILAQAHKDGVRVMINGFFGDDLYSGGEYLFADLWREGQFLKSWKVFRDYREQINVKHDLIDYGLRGLIPPLVKKWYRAIKPIEPRWKQWVHPQLIVEAALDRQNGHHPRFNSPGRELRYEALFFTGYALSVTTYKQLARTFGMAYRFPYFDRRIIEFFLSLPAGMVELPGVNRKILRDAVVDRLPESVCTRQGKSSLQELYDRGIYQEQWLEISNYLRNGSIMSYKWIRKDWLEQELKGPTRTQDGFILWLILGLALWLQRCWA
jgi:asparagine synthase (glutamine-hydrolysing)